MTKNTVRKYDNSLYDHNVQEYQDQQERQVAALREFYTERTLNRMTVVDGIEPLERSRIYGPFELEVIVWVRMNPFARLGTDADGREYVEY